MASQIENNKRIIKNTTALYVRMLIVMAVQLYASRVLLRVLGITDLGIYNIVGGVVGLFGFISSSMSISVQRFLAFDIGRNDFKSVGNTFNLSVVIHVFIAFAILILCETIGLYFVANYLTIPIIRHDVAIWVYHFSVLVACVRVLQVPFNALIIATEKMSIFAYLGIIDAVLILSTVLLVQWVSCDHLMAYGVITFAANVIVVALTMLFGVRCVPMLKISYYWNRKDFIRISSFAGWSAFGEISWGAVLQGVNIVLNLFFGPAVNAARGMAYQVMHAVKSFTQNFQMAMNPQIIKQYAAGQKTEMETLLMRGTRFSYFLMLLLVLPLLLRIEYVLDLWLGNVPPFVKIFTQLILINALLDTLSNLTTTVIKAYGKIRNYQIAVSGLLFLNLPFSYALLKVGCSPESTFWVYGLISVVLLAVRLGYMKNMVGLAPRHFFVQVIIPVIITSTISIVLPTFINAFVPNNFLGFVCMTIITCCWCVIVIWVTGLTQDERVFIRNKALSVVKRQINKRY